MGERHVSFVLTEHHLEQLFAATHFPLPPNQMLFLGLRGCIPVDPANNSFASSHPLEYVGTDYVHMRCTMVQWRPGNGFAIFLGSTVPHVSSIQSRIAAGGLGVNQLVSGYYRDRNSYYKGDHKLGTPNRRHRAFRNDSALPVWRTADDDDYDGDDRLDTTSIPGDNIHCSWQSNPSAPSYSSNGCQVVAGRPRVVDRGWNTEMGPWAHFIANSYGLSQSRFNYALLSGRELLILAGGAADRDHYQTVRFGSDGELVEAVQDALFRHGYDVGVAGADGDLGFGTLTALRQFQAAKFGNVGVDLIVGPATGKELGLVWPKVGDGAPGWAPVVEVPIGPAQPVARPASANGTTDTQPASDYRSLTPDGFFSASPFDLSKKRSIRTNNPGALNITKWQRHFKGFAGETRPDGAGNVTTIYFTPEHGIAAWHHLLTHIYGFGAGGSLTILQLARRYAGVPTDDHQAVKSYVAGWRKWSDKKLTAASKLQLSSDDDMVLLAHSMFGHEAGQAPPWHDDQVVNALALKRSDQLPQN
jgi:hypothetical protein